MKNPEIKLSDLILRCYAIKEDDSWFTICIDLNLYARADSFQDARSKLHEIIHEYIHEALTEDAQYISDLIPRKAPLYFRLQYFYLWILSKLKSRADHHNACSFNEPMPLVPA